MTSKSDVELSFQEFAQILLRWKWSVIFGVALCTAGAAAAAFLLPKKYEATVLISPVSNTSNNGLLSELNSFASQVGSIGSLGGVAPRSDSAKAESIAILQSEALTERFLSQNNLLPILFKDDWDTSSMAWKKNRSGQTPTLWRANEYFNKKIRSVSTDAKSGLVTLKITFSNPVLAAKWANELVKMTNDYRREKAIGASERNIAYLTGEAAKTDVLGVKQAIYSILQTEISRSMLARGNEEYALKVIDPASIPERASFPRPILWTVGAFIGSLGLFCALAFFRLALTPGTKID